MKANFPDQMLLFGCGNMAGAMLRGWLAAGIEAARFSVVKPTSDGLPDGVAWYPDAAAVGSKFDMLMLGVKPQMLGDVANDVRSLMAEGAALFSILAGVTHSDLQQRFPDQRVIRVMPNLAVEIGQSPLGIWAGDVSSEEKTSIDEIFSPLGAPEWLAAEEQMDSFTALAGSGPAFVYRFIDALAAGGTATGLPDEQAARIALQMLRGAGELAARSEFSPAELARRVASPGGMTAQGLDILDEEAALNELLRKTLRATRDRGAELAKLAQEDSDE